MLVVHVQADVSGIAMTAALGSPTEVTGDATIVANTLNVAQLTLGVVDPAPDAAVTGNFMIGALGTLGLQGDVSPVPTGFALTANLGSVTVDLNQQVNVLEILISKGCFSICIYRCYCNFQWFWIDYEHK